MSYYSCNKESLGRERKRGIKVNLSKSLGFLLDKFKLTHVRVHMRGA